MSRVNLYWNTTVVAWLFLCYYSVTLPRISCFLVPIKVGRSSVKSSSTLFILQEDNNNSNNEMSTLERSDSSSKNFVSFLTNTINAFFFPVKQEQIVVSEEDIPKTPEELLERIRDDYVKNNYLWTGNIYLPAFDENCTFTDPTLSFVGRQTFVTNVANLQPFLNVLFAGKNFNTVCESQLRSIQLVEDKNYIQSQWTMKGQFIALPWKPMIDVMGRTKFWFQQSTTSSGGSNGLQVYFYDEEWEIPAREALLQLITPGPSNSKN